MKPTLSLKYQTEKESEEEDSFCFQIMFNYTAECQT